MTSFFNNFILYIVIIYTLYDTCYMSETKKIDDYHKKFFIIYSSWYQIQLKAEIENVVAEVRAVIELERDDKGQVRQLSGEYQIHIHDFQLL